jgi:hypothetical protein
VLDGFVIKGDILESSPLNTAKGKTHVLKRHSLAISVSILVHAFIFSLLFFVAEEQPPKQIKSPPKAIKSYLYKSPPKPIVIEPKVVEKAPEEVKVKEKLKIEKKPVVPQSTKAPKDKSSIAPLTSDPDPSMNTNIQEPVQATFSAYKQLNSLRNSINKKIMTDELSSLQQFRSPSVMHGDQIPVPHSTQQLTTEQEREKNTTKMSDDISITKYDNGLCTIERKQFLGSPVEGSTAAFLCGESKFDKGFREHMKKVRDKIMPAKNK